jgi:hypothetical protein
LHQHTFSSPQGNPSKSWEAHPRQADRPVYLLMHVMNSPFALAGNFGIQERDIRSLWFSRSKKPGGGLPGL